MATDRTGQSADTSSRGPGSSVASLAALPLAPLYGAALAYLAYHPPRKRHHKTPADLGLTSSEVVVETTGGRRGQGLHLWLCPGDPERVVVMGHGLGLSKSASLGQARLLNEAGYTVALFDQRNHGKSLTDRTFWNVSERHTDDLLAVIGYMRRQPEHAAARFAVYGFSISTFPAFYMLRRAAECPIDAVVLDSGPADDLGALLRNFVDADGLPVPRALRGGISGRVVGKVFSSTAVAMLKADWPPPASGAYATTPMLFLTGEQDVIVPADEVRALAERYPRAEVRELPDTGHLLGIKQHPERYADTVLDFLRRTLKN